MKFSTRKDIEAPARFVFDQLADFGTFERAAMRRGITLRRLDTLTEPGAGMSWDIGFRFRGKPRQMLVDIRRFEPPELLEYAGQSNSFDATMALQVTALSRSRTRFSVALELKPRTLRARLLLQSAKLGKSRLDRKFDERVGHFASDIEKRAAQAGVAA